MAYQRHDPESESENGTPRWVKIFAIIFFAVVLLFLMLMFTRGHHRGPHDHMPVGSHSHTTSPGNHR